MANRVPLVIDVGTQRIVELPAVDSLDLTNSDIIGANNINATNFIGNGSQLTGVISTATSITNGTSSVSIPSANGNINISAGDTPNELVITNTGINVAGTLDATGNANVGNLGTSGLIVATGNITGGNLITTGTGNIGNITMTKFNEKVVAGGNTGAATLTPNASAGTIYTYTVTGAITLSALANAVAGTSMTVILTQGGSGSYLLTSTMKFAGAAKTLSTAIGSIDIISIFYDGTTYYASLTKGYA